MKAFRHFNADSLDAAVSILDKYRGKAQVVAGGTDLLGTLKDRVHFAYPEVIVNVKTIKDLEYIKEDAEGLKIGSLTKLRELVTDRTINEKYRLLAEAASSVASPQIRNMGTIGGNICQETRCWYYRNPENVFYCTRKGGKVCNALTGENRYHSIFKAARVSEVPCSSKCPVTTDIPSYMERIRAGDLPGAAKILIRANPLPAITGRVCPHFCEEGCNRDEFDEAVSIRDIERFMGDYILENAGEIIKTPDIDSGKSVAIIGSGPAGLSAAYYLRMSGQSVTVFDRMEEAGGMLAYGIPSYRLSNDVVRRQVAALKNAGIEFKLKIDVGEDITLDDLKKDFDGLFLASGAWSQPSIGLKGEELTKSGLEFLSNIKQGVKEVPGKKVLVIGGGNVAVDVGISALRLGAEEVTLVCLESREEMPALGWEIEQALEEGINLMTSWGPSRVLESDGKVTGIELVRCVSVFDDAGNFAPAFDDSVKETLESDQIMLAVGQKTDLSFIDPELSLKVRDGLIEVDQETQETNVPGIFAGGDVTSGPATVVEAIASGQRAATALSRYLQGAGAQNEEMENPVSESLLNFNSDYLKRTTRVAMPEIPREKRNITDEDALGLDLKDVEMEANRCFNCGCVAVNPSDIAPALIALDAKIKTTKRIVEAEEFFAVRPMKSTILDPDELVIEIQIPGTKPGNEPAYSKFRIRKSIDFPIVSVASLFFMDSGKIHDARIVLGAVAPVPLRIKEAEDFLKGKEVNQEVAEKAAIIAVKGAIPLARNDYKVQITRTLVKRSILALAR
jgi:NADPH-dependent glutamate synthase beta subunit-like oxidoreductase/CO/xanthine dehydrogenase FAD-binding subunit